MANMELSQGFMWGLLGGVLPEFYVLYNLRQEFHSKRPKWITSWFYWVVTAFMVLLGAGAVVFYLYSGTNISPFLAIHIGAATPTLVGSIIKARPEVDVGG